MILVAGVLLAGCSDSDDAKGDENKLTIWTFFGDVEKMADKFEEKYPEYQVDVKVFPGDQYQTKLQTALQSGNNVPDVFDLEAGYIGKFIDSKFVANLSDMGAEDLVKDYVPYVQELGRNEDGDLAAISDHSSPGGFWYQKEVAKKWLGTDDPNEISAMVDSWDKVIDLGKKVNADSDGNVHLISQYGDVYNVEASHLEPFVTDEKLNIDEGWKDAYEIQKTMFKNDVGAKLEFQSAGWNNALNEGNVVLTAMPAWASFMIDNEDGKAEGKYGVAKTPKGLYFGGTYRAIYDKSPNKDLAYKFVEFIASKEWQQYNLEETGNTPALMSVYEDNFESFTSPLTGDQDILRQYYDLVKDIPAKKADKYSEDVLGLWRVSASQGIQNDRSINEVIDRFKKEVKNSFPELTID